MGNVEVAPLVSGSRPRSSAWEHGALYGRGYVGGEEGGLSDRRMQPASHEMKGEDVECLGSAYGGLSKKAVDATTGPGDAGQDAMLRFA